MEEIKKLEGTKRSARVYNDSYAAPSDVSWTERITQEGNPYLNFERDSTFNLTTKLPNYFLNRVRIISRCGRGRRKSRIVLWCEGQLLSGKQLLLLGNVRNIHARNTGRTVFSVVRDATVFIKPRGEHISTTREGLCFLRDPCRGVVLNTILYSKLSVLSD
jgi:hypothetical protein